MRRDLSVVMKSQVNLHTWDSLLENFSVTMSFAAVSSSLSISTIHTFIPFEAQVHAMARPIPEEAPVMTDVMPSTNIMEAVILFAADMAVV